MSSLQVKDFPEELYSSLRDCAAAEDRSISQQTVHVLREYLKRYEQSGGDDAGVFGDERSALNVPDAEGERLARIENRKVLFARADALPAYELPAGFPDASEMIRQMRDERTEHIYNVGSDR